MLEQRSITMRTSIILMAAFSFLGVLNNSWAGRATELSGLCALNPKDPYETPQRVTRKGILNGFRCVDGNRFRFPHLWSTTEEYATVSNVQHDGKFWIAYFPVKEQDIAGIELLILRK